MKQLRVLIVDDELPARKRLENLLEALSDCVLVGSFGNPHHAVEALRNGGVDLVFLDVQMPELNGFEVVQAVGAERMPATIFVTAYDEYAIRAFAVAAIDYLLKPFDDERFEQALSRARETMRLRSVDRAAEQLMALVGAADPQLPQPDPTPQAPRLERLTVDVPGQKLIIPVEEIDYIVADGPYAQLHVGGKRHLIRERMHVLEARLDPKRFCRIHRSAIVNVDRIASLDPLSRGDHFVRLKDGTRLKLSRSHKDAVAERLGISI